MAWLAVNENGSESIFQDEPRRIYFDDGLGSFWEGDKIIVLSEGTIKKFLGRPLSWQDNAVEI